METIKLELSTEEVIEMLGGIEKAKEFLEKYKEETIG